MRLKEKGIQSTVSPVKDRGKEGRREGERMGGSGREREKWSFEEKEKDWKGMEEERKEGLEGGLLPEGMRWKMWFEGFVHCILCVSLSLSLSLISLSVCLSLLLSVSLSLLLSLSLSPSLLLTRSPWPSLFESADFLLSFCRERREGTKLKHVGMCTDPSELRFR